MELSKNMIFDSDIRSHTIEIDEDKFKFFFFGCWNQKRIATHDIINKINNNGTCNFGVVCGDNVYPEKNNDTKIAKIDDIIMGFDILKQFNGNVYIGLGNHEVDSTEKCKALFDEKQNANLNLIMPNNYYSIDVVNKSSRKLLSKLIILDTNMLEENTCYGKPSVVENEMLMWLKLELSKCENIVPIVMGHYPLFFFKQNKTTMLHDFKFNYTMQQIYEELINYTKPIYYLCADIHNYQHIISSNITQHIVGTGGALQDMVLEVNLPFPICLKPLYGSSIIFNVINCTQKYGYVEIDIENNIVTGEFKSSDIPVDIKEIKHKKIKTIQSNIES